MALRRVMILIVARSLFVCCAIFNIALRHLPLPPFLTKVYGQGMIHWVDQVQQYFATATPLLKVAQPDGQDTPGCQITQSG